ncbi:phage tail protein [Pseudomonas siliginis]|uniref:phage tail protein n=1 Tax=Pseudomonas siliginis TaxID=2842346 RepID=UPI00209338F8|nr:phage tail protein [Pseudomonas siliginis]UST81465.1 phage tail protein [Pseudomonas siliginis]
MIDANSQFFAILTNVGMAKQANADALGIPWLITQMGVGDANPNGLADPPNPVPSASQTKLINEWRRKPLNQLKIDPVNPAVIIAEQIIPADEGGKWIREIGLYDADGDLVAVANCAPSFKPLLSQGSGRTQIVRMNFIVTSTGNIQLKIDPSVVLATREYVDAKILEELYKLDSKQSVRVATTANIALTGLQSIDGVALAVGDRVLVKNQNAAKDNGIWVAAAAGWSRAADADSNTEVTSALLVSVEQGATLADTRWQLITDGAIVLGTTALVFQNVTQGFAPINSPALINPTANTPAQFDSSLKLATTEFVRRASGSLAGYVAYSASTILTAADAGKYIYANGVNITLTLPDLTLLPAGTKFYIQASAGSWKITVASVNGNFSGPNGAPAGFSTLVLSEGVASEFVSSGTGWIAVGGTGLSALAANGYQKLPGGLIIQWGSAMAAAADYLVTFPIAFPVGPMSLVFGQNEGSVSFHNNYLTATGFKYRNAAATYPDQFTWIAVGY